MARRRTKRQRLTPEQQRNKALKRHATKAYKPIVAMLDEYERRVLDWLLGEQSKTMTPMQRYQLSWDMHQLARAKIALTMIQSPLEM